MTPGPSIDGVLVQWGERPFYPASRIVNPTPTHRGHRGAAGAAGDGQGHGWRSRHGGHRRALPLHQQERQLDIEDDRGVVREGKEALHNLVEQWHHSGSLVDEVGHRREAFNIMLSMPHGTDAQIVRKAAREFAQAELAGHRYVIVLHDHQANPHVHLNVRAESKHGKRLNLRKADLHRWRETFADKLRGWGVEAEATRQATPGEQRRYAALWQVKAEQEGRLHKPHAESKSGDKAKVNRTQAMLAWAHITQALAGSDQPEDRRLAEAIVRYVRQVPHFVELERMRQRGPGGQRELPGMSPVHVNPRTSARSGPEIQR